MTTAITIQPVDRISNAIVAHPLRQSSGGVVPFTKWADSNSVNLDDKDAKKLARQVYNDAKIEFFSLNRKVLSMAASDPGFNITKFHLNDAGGFDASGRVPTKAQAKVSKSAEMSRLMDENARLQRELDRYHSLVKAAPATLPLA